MAGSPVLCLRSVAAWYRHRERYPALPDRLCAPYDSARASACRAAVAASVSDSVEGRGAQ